MNTVCWILLGLTGITLALYFIFTFAKKIEIIQKISSTVLFPLLAVLYILLLLDHIPDSLHTIRLAIISFIFLIASYSISCFCKNEKLMITSRISFIISLLPLIFLYKSVFLINRVPAWVNIIAASAYIVIFFLFFIIFIKKASFKFYGYSISALLIASFVNYCSLLILCFNPAGYSIVRFLGTSALLGYLVFQILNYSVIDLKLKKLISLMILLASLILIALSNLMILN